MVAVRALLGDTLRWVEVPNWSIIQPFSGRTWITQAFAVRSITGTVHKGVDWSLSYVPLLAVDDGYVTSTYLYGRDVPGLGSDGSPGGYGSTVLVRHDVPKSGTYYSYYCHMSSIIVRAGQRVSRGQKLGTSGTTGISSGPHLHFELRRYDNVTRLDPIPLIGAVIEEPDEWEEYWMSLTDAQKGYLTAQATAANVDAANWLKSNKTNLAPMAIAARDAKFTAGADTGSESGPVSIGIRRLREMFEVLQRNQEQIAAMPEDKYKTLIAWVNDLQERHQEG